VRHAWIDASAGVAGDMLLGALLDAGADLAMVQAAVDAVVPGAVSVGTTGVTRAGLRATKAEVGVTTADQPHRTWTSIRTMLDQADLPGPVRDRAAAVFGRLAEAEARVHGIDPAQVHFHEVGALDSIADVVGVAAALHDLQVATVSAGPVAVGSGTVRTAHGVLPVPVPAVAQLARDWRVTAGGQGELTTPTGMALVVTLAERCEDLPALQVYTVGVGAGTRDPAGRANVTRVVLGDAAARSTDPTSAARLLETNVDDLDPRLWPDVLQRLLRAGADDAWLVPILGKKGRPGHVLTVLGAPEHAAALRSEMLAATSTFGVRETDYRKYALPRAWFDVALGEVTVAVKVAHRNGVIAQASPEFDSVAAAAATLGQTQHEVLTAAVAAAVAAGLVAGASLPDGGRSTMTS
jgi:pyridinium-3,5-bisthiocarboxylic acid mononucleotide nickel chelatase